MGQYSLRTGTSMGSCNTDSTLYERQDLSGRYDSSIGQKHASRARHHPWAWGLGVRCFSIPGHLMEKDCLSAQSPLLLDQQQKTPSLRHSRVYVKGATGKQQDIATPYHPPSLSRLEPM